MDASDNYYQTLGLNPDAGAGDIKRAYREHAKQSHPDSGGSQAKMELINEANRVLSDPVLRREYDQKTATHDAPHAKATPRPATDHRAHEQQVIRHHKLRRSQARASAWSLLKNSTFAAVALTVVLAYWSQQLTDPNTVFVLRLISFLPVYACLLGLVFLIDPNFRLYLHDAPRRKVRRERLNFALVIVALSLLAFPLALAWALLIAKF